ncbi:VPLPA-CTERM-specific exosortase XrtD [Desulfosarcina sp.]|uniref:VPLPA-CTERM-specific exosortase XrtD n=1 Tax=Desulfosarcina sp. TaxID=2027861 RepID=UPI003563ED2F
MNNNSENVNVWIFPAGVLLAMVIVIFWDTLSGLYQQWMNNDDYSHGLLILPVSLFLIWEKRKAILELTPRMDWRGLLVMAAAVGLFTVGELGAELFTTRASIITLVIGAVWWIYGYAVIRVIAFPLLLLYLMLPLPGFVYRNLTFPLQLIASSVSVDILNTLGFLAYREGNVIDMGFSQFQVVEACNGLRFVLPLLCLGVIFAFYRPMIWWKRLVLVVVTVPLAVGTNVVRIAGTGILAHYFGVDVAQGFFHDFSGWVVFMVCFALFLGAAGLLSLLPGKPAPPRERTAQAAPTEPVNLKRHLTATGIALAVCLVSPMVVGVLGNVSPMVLKQDLADYPLELGGRTGRKSQMEAEIWAQVGGQEYTIIDYTQAGKPPINFYTAFYEYQKKGGDFIHSPRLCLPGAGWHVHSNRVRTLPTDSPDAYGGRLQINELIIEKNGYWQLSYFWYQGRGRNFTNEYAAKFYMVWDGIFRRRTDGALVRLISPMRSKEQVDEVRGDLDRFAVLTSKTLDEYLP